MIDFGFSKQYIDPKTNRHIPDSKVKRDFIGNYWFSSVNVHCRGKGELIFGDLPMSSTDGNLSVPSRRDDLEALALMLIHLLTPGGLSWTRNGVPKDNLEHDRLKRTKLMARPEDICRGMPDEFEEFLRYCRKLKFAETPDYGHWVDEFRGVAKSHGFPESDAFVWPPLPLPVSPLMSSVLDRSTDTLILSEAKVTCCGSVSQEGACQQRSRDRKGP